jgi:opacity protein-like surface antigen
MRSLARLAVAAILIVLTVAARPASADVTGFYGLTLSPWTHGTKGVAVGITLVALGVEFEYGTSSEDPAARRPGLSTGSVNAILQTPLAIKGVRLYGTAGAGVYRMVSGADDKFGVGINLGGGVKISVAGPISVRLDYRVFSLQNPPVAGKPQRAYAGLNLAF